MPDIALPAGMRLLCYDEVMARRTTTIDWPELRRKHRVIALLYVRHHGPAERRALQPSLHAAARLCDQHGRRAGVPRGRSRAAGGADVPRQRLGHPLCRRDGRRRTGAAGPAPGRRQPERADEPGARHHGRRRADGLDGPARAPAEQRRAAGDGAAHHDRRLRLPAAADRSVRQGVRRQGGARLGHDRALPGRHLQPAKAGARRAGRGRTAATRPEAGAGAVRHRPQDRRTMASNCPGTACSSAT